MQVSKNKELPFTRSSLLALGASALFSLSVMGCDQAKTQSEGDEAPSSEVPKSKAKAKKQEQKKSPTASELAQELRGDCEATMQDCSELKCSKEDRNCQAALGVCETKLASMCELVEKDAKAELAPCTEGTRCELLAAIHACFKESLGCDGSSGEDCKLKSLAKLPACLAKAMQEHGDCGGGGCPGNGSGCPGNGSGCPGNGSGCPGCDDIKGPSDGCLDPGKLGASCPAGGCLLKWIESMTKGQGGCLLDWLGKAGKGCPDCDE